MIDFSIQSSQYNISSFFTYPQQQYHLPFNQVFFKRIILSPPISTLREFHGYKMTFDNSSDKILSTHLLLDKVNLIYKPDTKILARIEKSNNYYKIHLNQKQ
jgi:hypothetical protein